MSRSHAVSLTLALLLTGACQSGSDEPTAEGGASGSAVAGHGGGASGASASSGRGGGAQMTGGTSGIGAGGLAGAAGAGGTAGSAAGGAAGGSAGSGGMEAAAGRADAGAPMPAPVLESPTNPVWQFTSGCDRCLRAACPQYYAACGADAACTTQITMLSHCVTTGKDTACPFHDTSPESPDAWGGFCGPYAVSHTAKALYQCGYMICDCACEPKYAQSCPPGSAAP